LGAWLAPRNKPPPHMCYHVKFGSSAIKGVRINRKRIPKLGSAWAPPPWGGSLTDHLEIRSSHTCYPTKFGRSRSNGASVIKEIRLKNLTPRVPHSFTVTQSHRNQHRSIRRLYHRCKKRFFYVFYSGHVFYVFKRFLFCRRFLFLKTFIENTHDCCILLIV